MAWRVPGVRWEFNPLLPHLPELLWGTIAFLIIAVVVWKLALPKYLTLLDERSEKIEGGLLAAERAHAEVAAERAKIADEVQNARREAAQIRADATETAAKTVAQGREAAQEEANRVIAQAQRQLLADRTAVQVELKGEIGALAVELAGKILGESVAHTDLQSRVIDRFLDELEAQTPATIGVPNAATNGVPEAKE